jgi:hypothetical protein
VTTSDKIDQIIKGGSAAAVALAGSPDNQTSPEVDVDGMLDSCTHWSVLITVTYGDSSMVATNHQYADGKAAKASYAINALDAMNEDGPYEGATGIIVHLTEPTGTWRYRHVAEYRKA